MNTCDTCKHWGDYNADGMYDSSRPAFEGTKICLNPKLGIRGIAKEDGCSCAAYEDHQTGQLSPGPKFGCVHHDPKP